MAKKAQKKKPVKGFYFNLNFNCSQQLSLS